MNNMEQIQHFTRVIKAQTRIPLDALVGSTIRTKNEDKVNELIERMCRNEYHLTSDQIVKLKVVLDYILIQ